ncbi:MAG: Sec-independent protein translocase protein TatB [Halioglobus sp.]|jgi:sec-independent protein translocase protein TatB
MFDIGFAELVIIAVVSLLVLGPERLPEAVRTASLWLNRIRRGFNDIKREVQQELHNDAVMQELRKTGDQLRQEANGVSRDVRRSLEPPGKPAPESAPEGGTPGEDAATPAEAAVPVQPTSPDQQDGGDTTAEVPAERKPE